MKTVSIHEATINDKSLIVEIDYKLDQVEHIELKRKEKITKAILNKNCFIIQAGNEFVGFAIFDHRFFDHGWIELIIIEEKNRGQGIGGQAINLLCKQCQSRKVFTSTNKSNIPMQKVLSKIGFVFSGQLDGLDEDDPELFYYKISDNPIS